jgi:hypothetical protein
MISSLFVANYWVHEDSVFCIHPEPRTTIRSRIDPCSHPVAGDGGGIGQKMKQESRKFIIYILLDSFSPGFLIKAFNILSYMLAAGDGGGIGQKMKQESRKKGIQADIITGSDLERSFACA